MEFSRRIKHIFPGIRTRTEENDDDDVKMLENDPDSEDFSHSSSTELKDITRVDSVILSSEPPSPQISHPPRAPHKTPWPAVFTLYAAVASDAVSNTIVSPFMPDMLKRKFGVDEEHVGTYVGIIIGIYSLSRFFSSFYLGHLSDLLGRKKIIIMGMTATTVGTALFGSVPMLWMLTAIRGLEGLFSATIPLARAALSDLPLGSDRNSIFAYFGAAFALSRSFSSAIGGLISSEDWTDDPYSTACFVGAGISLFSLISIGFLLPETYSKEKKRKQEQAAGKRETRIFQSMLIVFKDKLMMRLILLNCFNSLGNAGVLLGIVLFAALPREYKGLGFSNFETGMGFMFFGAVGFLWQTCVYKKVDKKFGLRTTYLYGVVMLGLGALAFPLSYYGYVLKPDSTLYVWIFYMPSCALMAVGFMQCLPVIGTLQSNAADPRYQGVSQGVSNSLGSGFRALGPIVSGAIFSSSIKYKTPYIMFVFLFGIYALIFLGAQKLPESLEKPKELPEIHTSTVPPQDEENQIEHSNGESSCSPQEQRN